MSGPTGPVIHLIILRNVVDCRLPCFLIGMFFLPFFFYVGIFSFAFWRRTSVPTYIKYSIAIHFFIRDWFIILIKMFYCGAIISFHINLNKSFSVLVCKVVFILDIYFVHEIRLSYFIVLHALVLLIFKLFKKAFPRFKFEFSESNSVSSDSIL